MKAKKVVTIGGLAVPMSLDEGPRGYDVFENKVDGSDQPQGMEGFSVEDSSPIHRPVVSCADETGSCVAEPGRRAWAREERSSERRAA